MSADDLWINVESLEYLKFFLLQQLKSADIKGGMFIIYTFDFSNNAG